MTVEFQLEFGVVMDMPGLPPLKAQLTDPPGVFRVLRNAVWEEERMHPSSVPTEWAQIGQTGWEAKMVSLAGLPMRFMIRPLGGVLPSEATG